MVWVSDPSPLIFGINNIWLLSWEQVELSGWQVLRDGTRCSLPWHWWNPVDQDFHYRFHGGGTPFPRWSAKLLLPENCAEGGILWALLWVSTDVPAERIAFQEEWGLFVGSLGKKADFSQEKEETYNQNAPSSLTAESQMEASRRKQWGPSSQASLVLRSRRLCTTDWFGEERQTSQSVTTNSTQGQERTERQQG